MKILSISDIHGSDRWKDAVFGEDRDVDDPFLAVDHVVFLGDYVDSYTKSDEQILTNLKEIITFKLMNPTRVTLLIGNHDINYMKWIPGAFHGCSGYRSSYAQTLTDLFKNNIDHFQIAAEFGKNFNRVLYTHAGLTDTWMKTYFQKYLDGKWTDIPDDASLADKLNSMLDMDDHLRRLLMIGRRRGGISPVGGPMWAHITEFDGIAAWPNTDLSVEADIPLGFHQVVGHNRVGHMMNTEDELGRIRGMNRPPVKERNGFTITFTDNIEESEELNVPAYFHIHDTEDPKWKRQ